MRLHRTGLLIIATATLVTSAPAAQADTQYGGTGLYKGTRPANPSISLLRRDDGRIAGRVVVGARCRGYANYSLVVRISGRTADGVNFSANGRTRLGRGYVRVTLTGTLAADAATGTARVRTTGCRTYRNPFTLRTPSAPAGAAAVPAPGTLMFGTTSQAVGGMALPVTIRVAKNGRVAMSSQTLVQCSRIRLPVLDFTPTRAVRSRRHVRRHPALHDPLQGPQGVLQRDRARPLPGRWRDGHDQRHAAPARQQGPLPAVPQRAADLGGARLM